MIKEISAEMLLGYYYPELESKWIVKDEGTFYRNYNRDIMSMDAETGELALSRDGLLRLLPDGAFSDLEEMRAKGDKQELHAAMSKRIRLLHEAFVPFDTFSFRNSLRVERQVSELLDMKLSYILRTYFCYNIEDEENPYVKEVATMLPFVSSKRGDLPFVATILRTLFDCKVEMDLSHRHSETDSTKAWMPMVRYNVLLEDMTAVEYKEQTKQLEPLARFITEWFIPFDVRCRISFRQHGIANNINGMLILDYNTEL